MSTSVSLSKPKAMVGPLFLGKESSSDCDKKVKDASSCIARAWRRSQATTDLLRDPILHDASQTSSRIFKGLILKVENKIARIMGIKNPPEPYLSTLRAGVSRLKEDRSRYHREHVIPVFTSIGGFENGKPVLPSYVLKTKEEVFSSSYKVHNGIYLTQEAWNQYELREQDQSTHPFRLISKEQLDFLVQALRKVDLFAWDYISDGCFARSEIMIQFLILMGVPHNRICKQYLVYPLGESSKEYGWRYHTAPSVSLRNSSKDWIIDPVLNRGRVLDPKEWTGQQGEWTSTREFGFQAKQLIDVEGYFPVSFFTGCYGRSVGSRFPQAIVLDLDPLEEAVIFALDVLAQNRIEVENLAAYQT